MNKSAFNLFFSFYSFCFVILLKLGILRQFWEDYFIFYVPIFLVLFSSSSPFVSLGLEVVGGGQGVEQAAQGLVASLLRVGQHDDGGFHGLLLGVVV